MVGFTAAQEAQSKTSVIAVLKIRPALAKRWLERGTRAFRCSLFAFRQSVSLTFSGEEREANSEKRHCSRRECRTIAGPTAVPGYQPMATC